MWSAVVDMDIPRDFKPPPTAECTLSSPSEISERSSYSLSNKASSTAELRVRPARRDACATGAVLQAVVNNNKKREESLRKVADGSAKGLFRVTSWRSWRAVSDFFDGPLKVLRKDVIHSLIFAASDQASLKGLLSRYVVTNIAVLLSYAQY
jgi:hypothetical protein